MRKKSTHPCSTKRKASLCALLLGLLLFSLPAWAQNPLDCEPPDVLLVTDFSASMNQGMNLSVSKPTKLEVMRQAYQEILTQYDKKIRFGLITFKTPTSGGYCVSQPDVRLQVPLGPNTASRCNQVLTSLRADGCTPMYPALQEALKHYQSQAIPQDSVKGRRRFVLLLTDGVPNVGCPNISGSWTPQKTRDCGSYLVSVVQKLRSISVSGKRYDVKTYVIGFGDLAKDSRGQWNMDAQNLNDMAIAGGTGKFFHAKNLSDLRKALQTVANNASNKVEICDNKDNDCDGSVDENLEQTCQGACGSGKKICKNGVWSACSAPMTKGTEVCNNKDDDCNGKVDDGLTKECPAVDNCDKGKMAQCVAGQWTGCSTQQRVEECNGKDDNCDGQVDEGMNRRCTTKCGTGEQACIQGDWSTCTAPQPVPEICDGKDNDCDGQVDEDAEVQNCDGQCLAGTCLRRCNSNECLAGFKCGSDNLCHPKSCEPECTAGQKCHYGSCVPEDCSSSGGKCRSFELCINKQCVPNPCLGIQCAAGQFCREGKCILSCAAVSCPSGKICKNGRCEEDLCAGKICITGATCHNGTCIKQTCPASPCGFGQTCEGGICVTDHCANIQCPSGQTCTDGECYGPNGPSGNNNNTNNTNNTNNGGTTNSGTTNSGTTNSGTTNSGTSNGGSNSGTTNGGTNGARSGGCVCSSSSFEGLPLSLLLLLFWPILLQIRRRRSL